MISPQWKPLGSRNPAWDYNDQFDPRSFISVRLLPFTVFGFLQSFPCGNRIRQMQGSIVTAVSTAHTWRVHMVSRLVILLAFLTAPCALRAVDRPNLVFILADDLGWSDTTLYGTTSLYETPNIQRLANRGMLFTNAYTAHPLCSPTRCSIMTGLDPARTGFTGAAGHMAGVILEKKLPERARPDLKVLTPQSVSRLDTEYVTLPETINAAGYVTGHFGKWHLGREPHSPQQHGFDVDVPHWWGPGPAGAYVAPWKFPDSLDFDPSVPDEHIEDRMADEAVSFIEKNKDKPFFLNYWAFSVHAPFDGKQELVDKYVEKLASRTAGSRPADEIAQQAGRQRYTQQCPVYGAMVESLDDAVGLLLDTLDRQKLSGNTIIVFFSDNGGNMYSRVDGIPPTSNAPLRGGKATIYEGGTRVPCAVVWPGKTQPGSRSNALLSSTDWYPTLIEMLQITQPADLCFDGVSQTAALHGQRGLRESLVCFVPNYFPQPETIPSTYVRQGGWKLIRFHGDGTDGADRFELYNLAQDIGESNNVAALHPDLVRQLDVKIENYLARTKAAVPVRNPAYDPKAKGQVDSPKRPDKRPGPETIFQRRDANKDGFVTLQEYIGNPKNRNVPALTRQFKRKDVNDDSRLTLDEIKIQKQQ
jgi:arylsulfatase A-like enzyme